MRHQPADKSQINRRPCFLPPTLGTDTSKYHLPKRDRLTCLGLDITDIRAHRIHDGADDNLLPFYFPALRRKKITAAFDGGRISSDGGVMLLAQADSSARHR